MDYYGSPKFVELLRSIKNIDPIVLPNFEKCYYCGFKCCGDCKCCEYKIDIGDIEDTEDIEVIKGRPEKNYSKCEKYFHKYYFDATDYGYCYDDTNLEFELENNIIKELDDPIENIKYLEFLLNEIDEDCELYCLIKNIQKDNYPPPLLLFDDRTNYYQECYNVKKSISDYKNGNAYLYYMSNVVNIIFGVFNTNKDKIWLLDELVKVKTKYYMDEYRSYFV